MQPQIASAGAMAQLETRRMNPMIISDRRQVNVRENGVLFRIWSVKVSFLNGPTVVMAEGDQLELFGGRWRINEFGQVVPIPCPYSDN